MVVFRVEGGDAFFADGAVGAAERWGLWAGHPLCRRWSGVGGEGRVASSRCYDYDSRCYWAGEGLQHGFFVIFALCFCGAFPHKVPSISRTSPSTCGGTST